MIEFTIFEFVCSAFALFVLGLFAGIGLISFKIHTSQSETELKNQIESYFLVNVQLENKIADLEKRLGITLQENAEMRKRIFTGKILNKIMN